MEKDNMNEVPVVTICPACGCNTPKHNDKDYLKLAVTYEKSKDGIYKQWWHKGCLTERIK